MSSFLEVELLRGKNYPQSEDDPNPCTTQVRASLFARDFTSLVAIEQVSSMQEMSNSPFYKDTLCFELPEDTESAILILKVVEFSRQREPYTIFYGSQEISVGKFKSKKELSVLLTVSDPIKQPEDANTELANLCGLGDKSPALSMRIQFQKKTPKSDGEDPNADVKLRRGISIDGMCQLVPADSRYVWFNLVRNKKWTDGFRSALIAFWQARSGNDASTEVKKRRKSTVAPEKAQPELRSIGDVITRRWACCRSHQVLTRLRISAEKYAKKDPDLSFDADEERTFRTEKKERAFLLNEMCQAALTQGAGNNLRDWLERLWTLFVIGIDNDPSGSRTLSYEVRKKVREAQFNEDDGVILQASLLYALVPTLPFEVCQSILEADYRAEATNRSSSGDAVAETTNGLRSAFGANGDDGDAKVTQHQRIFTEKLISVMGPMMDTLTESELLHMLKACKVPVWDAQQRIHKGGKSGIKARLSAGNESYLPKGDGIAIEHLDRYGNRKKSIKFV